MPFVLRSFSTFFFFFFLTAAFPCKLVKFYQMLWKFKTIFTGWKNRKPTRQLLYIMRLFFTLYWTTSSSPLATRTSSWSLKNIIHVKISTQKNARKPHWWPSLDMTFCSCHSQCFPRGTGPSLADKQSIYFRPKDWVNLLGFLNRQTWLTQKCIFFIIDPN